MNFYELTKEAITSSDISKKSSILATLFELAREDEIEALAPAISFETPSYSTICQIVEPNTLADRRRFHTKEGLGALLHSIAHIEYSAIDLALDAVYRFRDTPKEFRIDWLEVAEDEIRHFKMIEEVLNSLGFSYGDFPVHQGLFIASKNSSKTLLERMAVIPRYYEATGLDVNPRIIQKLKSVPTKVEEVSRSIEILQIIYNEEIIHVKKGDKWFKWECQRQNLNPYSTFFDILMEFKLLKDMPHINIQARLKAGFECSELRKFGVESC